MLRFWPALTSASRLGARDADPDSSRPEAQPAASEPSPKEKIILK